MIRIEDPEHYQNLDKAFERAKDEIKIHKEQKHENVVKIFAYEIYDYNLEFIMEYSKRGSLYKCLNKKRENGESFDEVEIINMMIMICKGVEHIHENKIAHLDLKPANILTFCKKGHLSNKKELLLKICDFGLSKEILPHNIYPSGRTPAYASPELLMNKEEYSGVQFESDIWALGCILYELCTLRIPFIPNYKDCVDHSLNINLLGARSKSLQILIQQLLTVRKEDRSDIKISYILSECYAIYQYFSY